MLGESGIPMACLASCYLWEKKYDKHGLVESRKLRQLRGGNACLQCPVDHGTEFTSKDARSGPIEAVRNSTSSTLESVLGTGK